MNSDRHGLDDTVDGPVKKGLSTNQKEAQFDQPDYRTRPPGELIDSGLDGNISARLHIFKVENRLHEAAPNCVFMEVGPYVAGQYMGLFTTNIRVYRVGDPDSRRTIPASLDFNKPHEPQIFSILELVPDCKKPDKG
jgi:hypothetical protein